MSISLPPFDSPQDDSEDDSLTPTTYGSEIDECGVCGYLSEDGPGDDAFDIKKLRLVPIVINSGEKILAEIAVRRGQKNPLTNWGQRLAIRLCEEGDNGNIDIATWPIDTQVIFPKTVWWYHGGDGYYYIPCVLRTTQGFLRDWQAFEREIDHNYHFPSLTQ